MNKDTFYFSHDYNARNDRKIAPLVKKYKSSGYGIYLTTVEMLHEEQGCLELDEITFSAIGKDLNEDSEYVKEVIVACIYDFKLFYIDEENCFSSNRVKRNLDKRSQISTKRSISGKKGARIKQELSNCQANGEQMLSNCQANADKQIAKERKGKEIKGKEIKEEIKKEETTPEFPMEKILTKTWLEYTDLMKSQAKYVTKTLFEEWRDFVFFIKDNCYFELFACKFINPMEWADMQRSDTPFPKDNWKITIEAILSSGIKPEHTLRYRIPKFQEYNEAKLVSSIPQKKKLVV